MCIHKCICPVCVRARVLKCTHHMRVRIVTAPYSVCVRVYVCVHVCVCAYVCACA